MKATIFSFSNFENQLINMEFDRHFYYYCSCPKVTCYSCKLQNRTCYQKNDLVIYDKIFYNDVVSRN